MSRARNPDSSEFYVYLLLDPRRFFMPFYVGKGKGNRPRNHLGKAKPTNRRLAGYIRKMRQAGCEPVVSFWVKELTEEAAYALERDLVARFGRRGLDDGGILMNLTSGGDGCGSGIWHPKWGKKDSEETKKKRRDNTDREKLRTWLGVKGAAHPAYGHQKTDKQIEASRSHMRSYNSTGKNIRRGAANGNYGKKHPGLNAGPASHWYGKTGAAHPSYGRSITDSQKSKISKTRILKNQNKIKEAWARHPQERISVIAHDLGISAVTVWRWIKGKERLERIIGGEVQ